MKATDDHSPAPFSPEYPKSIFGRNLTRRSGILELMDDLGDALTAGRGEVSMMGGGNPGRIPGVLPIWREQMRRLLDREEEAFDAMLADYNQPAGSPRFREAVAMLLSREFGWPIAAGNVAVTNGGQTAFFFLLNRFAGEFDDGSHRRVLLPLVPEYIGYADQGVGRDLFVSRRPEFELLGEREFKYRIDFDRLELSGDIAAIAVSRPTNPSGNVLTDGELRRLSGIARNRKIPLMIDNAYGAPFPGVIFEDITPIWDDHLIVTLSLSKLGLPGARTGIVIAREDIIVDLSAINAICSLANNNVGQALTLPLIESGEILRISRNLIQPFYRTKCAQALALLHEHLPADAPWRIHKSEGAFFLWIWFEGLPIPTRELYRRLKARKTLILPGEYFFFGLDDPGWSHRRECIRLSYAQPEETVRKGIAILGEEVARAYRT